MTEIAGGQCRLIGWSIISHLPSAVVVVNPSPFRGRIDQPPSCRLYLCRLFSLFKSGSCRPRAAFRLTKPRIEKVVPNHRRLLK